MGVAAGAAAGVLTAGCSAAGAAAGAGAAFVGAGFTEPVEIAVEGAALAGVAAVAGAGVVPLDFWGGAFVEVLSSDGPVAEPSDLWPGGSGPLQQTLASALQVYSSKTMRSMKSSHFTDFGPTV